MRKFIEKSFIALFCLFNTYIIYPSRDLPLYFLASVGISLCLDLIHVKGIRNIFYITFLGLYIQNPLFKYYLPLMLYNLYSDYGRNSFFPLLLMLKNFSPFNLLISILSLYLSRSTKALYKFLDENKIVRDELKEDTIYLRKYNEQLKIDREKNIHIAILTERNRIARELHDSIGHALSSSILQVEALKVVSDNTFTEELNLLQNTLNNGMDDIRNSIHNLYNESMDLKSKIEGLWVEAIGMDFQLVYGLENNLPYDLKFDILSVVREAITNCVKHSNAAHLKISLVSHPKFYSIIIKDDGNRFDKDSNLLSKGIGLLSINEIAEKYNGFLNYSFDNGFKIHLTLMKG